ncbi:hypothetical protein [Streptomyces lydicus]|nr:hypothetical protein [Streptomyces lydicus]
MSFRKVFPRRRRDGWDHDHDRRRRRRRYGRRYGRRRRFFGYDNFY